MGVFNRRVHTVTFREALGWSAMWIALASAFAVLVYFWHGRTESLEFATGYLIELSLSIDNLFVFLVIFRFFRVPSELQHRVLFWGILGALITRGIFILAGVSLIQRFHWLIYVFGALLVYSGIKLLRQGDEEVDPERNPLLKLFRKWIPVTEDYEGEKFWVRRPGLYATPLVVVLLVVETTDIVFAVDSIPAVLAITLNAFIVYTSNVFAILGLRSMRTKRIGRSVFGGVTSIPITEKSPSWGRRRSPRFPETPVTTTVGLPEFIPWLVLIVTHEFL